jgi:hypothetical protein
MQRKKTGDGIELIGVRSVGEAGAIVAVTTHGGAAADTVTVQETVIEAAIAVADLIAENTPEGEYEVHPDGVQEVVADKGYHSNEVALGLAEMEVRTYIAEPDRGPRNWNGKAAEKAAVYGNRRRIQGDRGKGLQRQRGERIERNFAHQFDTGGLNRLYVRGKENVHKKFLMQAAACNLALLMRSTYGSGKPRAAHDRAIEAILAILAVIKAVEGICTPWSAHSRDQERILPGQNTTFGFAHQPRSRRFRHGLLTLFRYYKKLGERAMEQVTDEQLFAVLDGAILSAHHGFVKARISRRS